LPADFVVCNRRDGTRRLVSVVARGLKGARLACDNTIKVDSSLSAIDRLSKFIDPTVDH